MNRQHATSQEKPATLHFDVIDREMARVLAEKTPAERLQIAWGMWRSARRMICRMLAAEHPEWSQQDIDCEVARRMAHGSR